MQSQRGMFVVACVSACLGGTTGIAVAADTPLGGSIQPFYPGINILEKHDNNIFSQPSTAQRTESWITVVSPFVSYDSGLAAVNRYSLLYQADVGRYQSSSQDDYTDQQVLGKASFGFSDKGKLKLEAEYLDAHDPRGAGRSEGSTALVSDADEWHSTRGGLTLDYGSEGAPARVSFDAGYLSKRYDNNEPSTDSLERDNTDVGVTFYWRVAPETSLLVQAAYTDIDYPSADLDSNEQRALVGVSWDVTAPLSGTVKAGYLKKDFDAASRNDFSGGSWSAEIRWSPLTYSVFDLSSSRKTTETYGIGDFILTKDIALKWTHAWTSDFKSIAGFRLANDQYNDAAGRRDDISYYDAKLVYRLLQWLEVGTGASHSERSSNVNTYDYSRTLYYVSAKAGW